MTSEKSSRELALELFVYAPIGLALEVRELLPKLVERGRGQVAIAQLIGRMAAEKGRSEVSRTVERLFPHGDVPDRREAGANGGAARPAAAAEPTPEEAQAEGARPEGRVGGVSVEAVLPGYDDLPAASIVKELDDLGPDELDVIERYEQTHRRRITILNKIDRLRQDPSAAAPKS